MSYTRSVILTLLLAALLIYPACAPQATPVTAPQVPAAHVTPAPPAALPAAPTSQRWEIEWERLLAEAKKEGTVTLATSSGAVTRAAVTKALRSRFGIPTEWLAGTAGELSARIKAERRSRIYSVDAVMIGATVSVSDLKPAGILERMDDWLFLPELTDSQEIRKVWRSGELDWVDNDHTSLNFLSGVSVSVAVNTQLVQPGEIKAFRDLLAPKWKGKMVLLDPTLITGPGASMTRALGDYIVGWDFVRQLAAQEPMLTTDGRLQMVWVAQGKYAIALGIRSEAAAEFLDIGAPVKVLLMEEGGYTASGAGAIAVLKNAPHPNAVKFLLNWLLTQEGQTLWCSTAGRPSNRLDASTEGVTPEMIPDPKKKYANASTEEWALGALEAQKKAKEIFGKLKK